MTGLCGRVRVVPRRLRRTLYAPPPSRSRSFALIGRPGPYCHPHSLIAGEIECRILSIEAQTYANHRHLPCLDGGACSDLEVMSVVGSGDVAVREAVRPIARIHGDQSLVCVERRGVCTAIGLDDVAPRVSRSPVHARVECVRYKDDREGARSQTGPYTFQLPRELGTAKLASRCTSIYWCIGCARVGGRVVEQGGVYVDAGNVRHASTKAFID